METKTETFWEECPECGCESTIEIPTDGSVVLTDCKYCGFKEMLPCSACKAWIGKVDNCHEDCWTKDPKGSHYEYCNKD